MRSEGNANAWCTQEFESIDLGDPRLNRRLIQTAEMISKQPLDPIHKSCGESWATAKGAYRLFDNSKLTLEKILQPHREKTLQRMQAIPRVLAIQDTSSLNFHDLPKVQGLGPIGSFNRKNPTQGLILHSAFALDPRGEGIPLGLLHLDIWARENKRSKKKGSRRHELRCLPIEQKESFKWIEFMQKTLDADCPGVEIIHVADREADIFEWMEFALQNGGSFLVRAHRNRKLKAPHPMKLWEEMDLKPCIARAEVEVSTGTIKKSVHGKKNIRLERQARTAGVEIRFSRVTLCPPNPKVSPGSLVVDAIWVKEPNPPEGEIAVEWMLLTNVPTESLEEVLERIHWYQQRWHIESFHKVLKSGCRIEDCRLESADRLIRYIGVCSIVAWRLYWLSRVSRADPEHPCALILEDHEWKALYCKIHKTNAPPSDPPSARQAIRWLAQLGGFLGRKSDGEPGIKAIWRGWQRMTDIAEDWLIFSNLKTCG